MTDTDPQMVLFLNYIDDNDDCRALDVTVPLSISSIIYDVTSITANGWWASGGSPNLTPPDMKLGTTPFFSGVQVMHVCESGFIHTNQLRKQRGRIARLGLPLH